MLGLESMMMLHIGLTDYLPIHISIHSSIPFQRPRKVGAKFTGNGMAPDEHSQISLDLDYDGKRDRWNGYDPEDHMRIVEEYAKVDQAKQTLKSQKLHEELASGKLTDQAVSHQIFSHSCVEYH